MTHAEAIKKMCNFLRWRGYASFPEVPMRDVIPDIVGIKRSFKQKMVAIFEIKVSRQDFLQEIRAHKYDKALPIASKFYYACPMDMIKPEELPEGCGLYYIPETMSYTDCVCVKHAKAKVVEMTEDMLWHIILSFETKYVKGKEGL